MTVRKCVLESARVMVDLTRLASPSFPRPLRYDDRPCKTLKETLYPATWMDLAH